MLDLKCLHRAWAVTGILVFREDELSRSIRQTARMTPPNKQGLRTNWRQFSLLVIINAFVGGMVGLERSIFPQLAEQEFGLASKTAMLSFIMAFGVSKAIANYYTGKLADRVGRKWLLVIGWLVALPVPVLFIYTTHWNGIVFANILLGISQGLTWSSTVIMKIDLVGERDRGLAMGLNEFAGYVAVGLMAFLSGYIANRYGLTPYPFYLGIVIAGVGFVLSLIWAEDTRQLIKQEQVAEDIHPQERVFLATTLRDKTLSAVTQAGLVNNLNDGMLWGLLPVLLVSLDFNNADIGVLAAIYPAVWGIGQLFTGKMGDHYPLKPLLFWGMLLQGLAILLLPKVDHFVLLAALAAVLGLGTALVYPNFLTTIARITHPQQRAESIGVFRLWRDLGYAIGALLSGVVADQFGISYAISFIGVLTLISAAIIQFRMPAQIKV
jgi:predicted MFS family arabinose efflux permease